MAEVATITKQRRRKAEKIAAKLGVGLGSGLKVNGYHRCDKYDPAYRFGTYDLILNVEAERVECGQCGATDLVRSR